MNFQSHNIFRNLLIGGLFAAALISSAGVGHAALSMDYTVGGSGSIYYDPTVNNFLNGNNLTVSSVTGNDTQLNAGVTLPITSGLLNFQTGALTGQTGNIWNFDGPGTITVQVEYRP